MHASKEYLIQTGYITLSFGREERDWDYEEECTAKLPAVLTALDIENDVMDFILSV